MMHVVDIEEALDEFDLPALQGAFRALVDFPHEAEIEGAESVQTLIRLLDLVAFELRDDHFAMPAATCDVITKALAAPMPKGSTYADGAKAVSNRRDHWRELYLAYMADDAQSIKNPAGTA